jgi:hypothetical protein
MQTRSLVFALSLISLAACQEDMTEVKASWEKSTKDWATRLETARKGQAELVARSKSFELPGADAALVSEKAAIDKGIETSGAAVTDAEQHLTTSKGVIEGLIAKGKKVPVEVALSAEKGVVDGAIAKAQSLVNASNEGLDNLAKKAASIKAAGEAARSRTEAWTTEAKKKGGMLAIDDLLFNAENLDLEKSNIALPSLLATLKSCAELKVDLAVAAVGEGELGSKRAEALKTYLTTNGVPAAVFGKVAGTTTADGDAKVTVTIDTPCK